jgi:hypothetical protein
VDPSLSTAIDALGAPPGQTSASVGKLMSTSTLGATPAPKVLKVKKLNVKKSSL